MGLSRLRSNEFIFLAILEGNAGYIMVPWDWKTLIKSLVSPPQYVVWLQEYRDLCTQQAISNLDNNIHITADMLLGEGAFNTAELQAHYAVHQTYDQIANIVLKA